MLPRLLDGLRPMLSFTLWFLLFFFIDQLGGVTCILYLSLLLLLPYRTILDNPCLMSFLYFCFLPYCPYALVLLCPLPLMPLLLVFVFVPYAFAPALCSYPYRLFFWFVSLCLVVCTLWALLFICS